MDIEDVRPKQSVEELAKDGKIKNHTLIRFPMLKAEELKGTIMQGTQAAI